jgi:hypothetical protein
MSLLPIYGDKHIDTIIQSNIFRTLKAESNNKSKSRLSLLFPSSITTRLTIVYFGVSIGIALQIGAANWDIIWHGITDVESFFTPPHTVLYSGVALTIGSIFIGIIQYVKLGEINREKEREHEHQSQIDKPSEPTTTNKSLSSYSFLTSPHYFFQSLFEIPYPIKLVAIGTTIEIFSGGFDSWWHYTFGFDGLLSPPHLLLTIGMLTSVYGVLLGIYKLLQNNRHSNNNRNGTLLKISFIVTYAVAWIVSVNTIFMFSLPYSKGQYFDFNPNPFAAIFIASISIPFVSAMIFYSAAKTLRDVRFRFTFITLAFMIIHSTATIISSSHFAILYPLYLLNIIPALIADLLIMSKRSQHNKKEKRRSMTEREQPRIAHHIFKRLGPRLRASELLRNHMLVVVSSAIVPIFFITLFFPWSVNVYKAFFGIDMNTFESLAIFNLLFWPFIIPFVITVSVLMSLMGSYTMSRVLSKTLS